MNPLMQRFLAFLGLIGIVSLLGYGIFVISDAAAAAANNLNRSFVMTVTSISIFGGMLAIAMTLGRLIGGEVEAES